MVRFFTIFIVVLASVSTGFSQSEIVKGRVTSTTDGMGLPGVNIIIEGTLDGTTTDINGDFSIEVSSDDVLVFKMIGMQTAEIPVGGQSVIDVMMKEERQILDNVVINGFQEVDRNLFTGSAERVTMDEIQVRSEVDASRMLEGQVAGVSVDNLSATFGTSPKIRIRGNTSIKWKQPAFICSGWCYS